MLIRGKGLLTQPLPAQIKPGRLLKMYSIQTLSNNLPMQLLPAQIEAGRGTAIFTGATASLRGGAKFALLAAPKFALRALAQSAAREFQSKVRCTSLFSVAVLRGNVGEPKNG